MAKNLSDCIQVRGLCALAAPVTTSRMWGCSYSLSKAYNTSDEVLGSDEEMSYNFLYDGKMQVKQIMGKPDKYGIAHPVADIIFMHPHHWQALKAGRLYRIFSSVRYNIQNAYKGSEVVNSMAAAQTNPNLN